MLVEDRPSKRVLLQPGHREHLAEAYLLAVGRHMKGGVALLQFSPSPVGQFEPVRSDSSQHDVEHRYHHVQRRNSDFHILTLFYNPNQARLYSLTAPPKHPIRPPIFSCPCFSHFTPPVISL